MEALRRRCGAAGRRGSRHGAAPLGSQRLPPGRFPQVHQPRWQPYTRSPPPPLPQRRSAAAAAAQSVVLYLLGFMICTVRELLWMMGIAMPEAQLRMTAAICGSRLHTRTDWCQNHAYRFLGCVRAAAGIRLATRSMLLLAAYFSDAGSPADANTALMRAHFQVAAILIIRSLSPSAGLVLHVAVHLCGTFSDEHGHSSYLCVDGSVTKVFNCTSKPLVLGTQGGNLFAPAGVCSRSPSFRSCAHTRVLMDVSWTRFVSMCAPFT